MIEPYRIVVIKVLTEAGERGLSIKSVTRHAHNAINSIFAPIDYQDTYSQVQRYLRMCSKTRGSGIVRHQVKGRYMIDLSDRQADALLPFANTSDAAEERGRIQFGQRIV